MREELLALIEKNSKIGLKDLAAMLDKSEMDIANEITQMEKKVLL